MHRGSVLRVLWVVAALSLTSPALAVTAKQKEMVTIYSNVCYHEESGDLIGELILILRQYSETYVVYQEASGILTAPEPIKAKVDGDRIDIELPEATPGYVVTFSGKLTDKAIIGRFSNAPEKVVRLTKQPNVSRGAPDCK
jgi:hypothetical protein